MRTLTYTILFAFLKKFLSCKHDLRVVFSHKNGFRLSICSPKILSSILFIGEGSVFPASSEDLHLTQPVLGRMKEKPFNSMLNLWNFKTKMQNTSKLPHFQNTLKYQNTSKFRTFFPKFPNFGAKDSWIFCGFEAFSAHFSERLWKTLKYAAFAVKIGVDSADILAFWAWNGFWYFDY